MSTKVTIIEPAPPTSGAGSINIQAVSNADLTENLNNLNHNLINHQKTLSCLEFQGEEIKRKNRTGNSKKIQQIDKNTLEVIKEFDSLKIAVDELKIVQKKLYKILKNEIEYDYKLKYF